MKTTKTTRMNARTATQLSFSALMLLALTVAPLGCAEKNDEEGTEQVSTKTGALSDSDGEGKSFRKHGKSDKHDRKDGMRRIKHGRKGDKRHDPSGILFKTALKQDSLTAEQREKIESLMAEKKHDRKGARGESKKAFRANLAQAVRDGNVDADVMTTHFENKTKQREARMAARTEMLNTLYATLDSTQRQAVIDDVKANREHKGQKSFKGKERHGDEKGKGFGKGRRGKRHGDKGERGMRAKSDCSRDGKSYRGKRGGHGRRGDGMFMLVKGLDLSEEQQTQIATLKQNLRANRPDKEQRKAKKEEMKQCRMSFLESFATDNFDAAAARCQKGSPEKRTSRMNQRVAALSSLVNILTKEQRNQLADRIETPQKRRDKASRI